MSPLPRADRAPRESIRTERLLLRCATDDEAPLLVDYFERNRAHLAPWEPEPPPGFFTSSFWLERLAGYRRDWASGSSHRFHLFTRGESRIIGTVGVSNVVRGCFYSANLGFGLDASSEGKGLMREACEACVAFAWKDLSLHRIEASHQPQNLRSAGLLRRLGFIPFGYSRDYLFIAGRWVDHVNTALLNASWKRPEGK
jgi:ribosomal-protein-alanine N-acetyltransferase